VSEGHGNTIIGTSGWNYSHWKRNFYPVSLTSDEWLPFYADRLPAVEVNNSFYQLPERNTVAEWRRNTPSGFRFAVKASRYITHMKKLRRPTEALDALFEALEPFGEKLGPILFQLPPKWRANIDRLEDFLSLLPEGHAYTFEFRDPSWFRSEVYELLAENNCAFCLYELAGTESPREVTADFVYIRLHGPGGKYEGSYDSQTLAGWAGACHAWSRAEKDVYCFFDNDEAGYAVANAQSLYEMTRSFAD
jgi:uncharacterized protein YecE (DUF72 family)